MKDYVKEKGTQRKGMKRDAIILGITLIITIALLSIFPDKQEAVITTSWNFFIEMILILPAVMVLMGLFSVFVPKEMVVRYLGKAAGIKAVFLGILMGSLPTGPLYVAFPMASALIKKGAKISCIIAFISAWACIKIPQEVVELQFLGPKFMAARLILTIIFVAIMGILIERLIEWSDKKKQTNLRR
ncbi:MAG: permease [Candidatus Marinimicrobia bacterium]|nr:permease [Candidatus Neomarinimicrobiota bacterium]